MHRVGAVAIVKDDSGKFHRGMFILPMGEIIDGRIARKISMFRAMRAYGTKESDIPVKIGACKDQSKRKAMKGVDACWRFWRAQQKMRIGYEKVNSVTYKSGYDVCLTDYEKKLFVE